MLSLRRSKKRLSSLALVSGSFKFVPSSVTTAPTSWGTWLQTQAAPSYKPGHRLKRLSIYTYGSDQEYEISLDMCERWGYALNIGYGRNIDEVIAESKLSRTVAEVKAATSQGNLSPGWGKLIKLAIQDTIKYPVAGAVIQGVPRAAYDPNFPNVVIAPDAYLKDASGNQLYEWSPEATPAAMQITLDFKMTALRKLAATGAKIAIVYDGGETGLGTCDNAATFALDPRVVAAKGSLSWVDYISKKKADQHELVYKAVQISAPTRDTYVYYTVAANPYSNIPGIDNYAHKYSQMQRVSDLPSNSVYYKDKVATLEGMTNPLSHTVAYYDQLTHFVASVAEQIVVYSTPHSYSFLSAGFRHTSGKGIENPWFLAIDSYKGFLKCMYACGNIGGIASYFSDDVVQYQFPYYADYDATNPPHWLQQQQALGEVHARFSWLDEYLFDGDLLQGDRPHVFKTYLPSFEYTAYDLIEGFLHNRKDIRVFARKLRSAEKWLVVLCVGDKPDGSTGIDTPVYVKSIAGLGTLSLLARGKGSIYTIDRTSGNTVITLEDP